MMKNSGKERMERALSVLLVILVLPCALTLLLGGRMQEIYRSIQDEAAYISVQSGQGIRDRNLEEYVIGVTASQIPLDSDLEAVKAQMVVTRTNLYRSLEDGKVWDGDYRTLAQLENAGAAEKFLRAQRETKRQILTWEGQPVMASFHAVSAGQTRDGAETFLTEDYPYLKSKTCPADKQAPGFETVVQIDEAWRGLQVIKRDSAGYVQQLQLGDTILSGEEFRALLGLPSSHFTVEERTDGVFLTVQGIGHGLGMSQYTARQLAHSGKTYREILGYFFAEVRLQTY